MVQVKEWYQRLRKDEPADVWLGADANKVRLMALKSPPRVLHLATHGFYLPGEVREPMLLSDVALAGANRELEGNAADGILFALEAQGLNLDGSELVVLSACDTAKGSIDYSFRRSARSFGLCPRRAGCAHRRAYQKRVQWPQLKFDFAPTLENCLQSRAFGGRPSLGLGGLDLCGSATTTNLNFNAAKSFRMGLNCGSTRPPNVL
ncbi:CHAT domain-containing protein [Bradyrhizobium sp. CB1650]|uniref:CHAT domain-containing protein n=1 Tax=Bradyrhizobium sp. CB1650 TaxID=3039153 RepID=UPI00325FA96E